jgi:hypothetical protein
MHYPSGGINFYLEEIGHSVSLFRDRLQAPNKNKKSGAI